MRAKVGFEEVDGRECIVNRNSIPSQQSRYDQAYCRLVNDKKMKVLQIFVMNQIETVCVSCISLKRDATQM
jgi:hypothetical protein